MAGGTSRARKAPPGSIGGRRGARAGSRFGDGSADRRPAEGGHKDGLDPERDDPESVARLICLRLLTAAPRTQAELAATLRRRGIPDDAAETVLARFA